MEPQLSVLVTKSLDKGVDFGVPCSWWSSWWRATTHCDQVSDLHFPHPIFLDLWKCWIHFPVWGRPAIFLGQTANSATGFELQPWTHQHHLARGGTLSQVKCLWFQVRDIYYIDNIYIYIYLPLSGGRISTIEVARPAVKCFLEGFTKGELSAPFYTPPPQWVGCWGRRSTSVWWGSWPLGNRNRIAWFSGQMFRNTRKSDTFWIKQARGRHTNWAQRRPKTSVAPPGPAAHLFSLSLWYKHFGLLRSSAHWQSPGKLWISLLCCSYLQEIYKTQDILTFWYFLPFPITLPIFPFPDSHNHCFSQLLDLTTPPGIGACAEAVVGFGANWPFPWHSWRSPHRLAPRSAESFPRVPRQLATPGFQWCLKHFTLKWNLPWKKTPNQRSETKVITVTLSEIEGVYRHIPSRFVLVFLVPTQYHYDSCEHPRTSCHLPFCCKHSQEGRYSVNIDVDSLLHYVGQLACTKTLSKALIVITSAKSLLKAAFKHPHKSQCQGLLQVSTRCSANMQKIHHFLHLKTC